MNYLEMIDGKTIPQVGLGTFDLKAQSICNAIQNGYRLLDTAWQYGNEKEVGQAVQQSNIDRAEIFITTKLWTEHVRKRETRKALEESLNRLAMDYVDLYLIHWPAEGFEYAWDEMIKLRDEGKTRHIGVSNFTEAQLNRIMESGVVPVINQIESHPYFRNDAIIEFCKKRNILAQAWCPLGGSYSNLKSNVLFAELSKKYHKTVAQIILRWHTQRNVLIIPRSQNDERQKENIDLFNFELTEEDMYLIDNLNTDNRMGANPDNFNF